MKKNLYFNNITSIVYQVFAVLIGLFLPRVILGNYGSEISGLVNSITQFLSIISLLDLGVGAVVQSNLYRPLVEKDYDKVTKIYLSSVKYFGLIAKILIAYVFVLCLYFSCFKSDIFPPLFSITLIISISISYFAQYYFGMTNTLLLNSDQKNYIVSLSNLISLIVNAIITVLLIRIDVNIQVVKLTSSIIFLFKPLFYNYYVKKNYPLNYNLKINENYISNKWSGLFQHVAVVITGSIDVFLLTIFSTFNNVSIYNIYVLPLNSIRNLFEVVSNNYKSFFGKLIAKNNSKILLSEFNKYEVIYHYVSTTVFSVCLVMITPFVQIYSSVVSDANYFQPIFGYIISLAYYIFVLRMCYTNIIFSAGKFKETNKYSALECIINFVLSLILVLKYGLVGVAIGTIVSSGYRLLLPAWYVKKDILKRKYSLFLKQLIVDVISIFFFLMIANHVTIDTTSFINFIISCCFNVTIAILTCLVIFVIFNYKIIKKGVKK